MSLFDAIILGIVQGITEFLPISSSAHLIIFQNILGFKEPEIFFDISLHLGTLFAVAVFFWKDLKSIFLSFKNLKMNKESLLNPNIKLCILIIIASFPTGIIGLSFHKIANELFSSIFVLGFALIATGFILLATYWSKEKSGNIDSFSYKQAFIIGIIQGIAVIPGISRSGSTISAGLFLGLNREMASKFSFLLSIPAILGAHILSLRHSKVFFNEVVVAGVITAAIVGYLSLFCLTHIIKKGKFYLFAPYCLLMGLFCLIYKAF